MFNLNLNKVLKSLENTIADLATVARQQGELADKQRHIIAVANVVKIGAEVDQARANRMAAKLEELLK